MCIDYICMTDHVDARLGACLQRTSASPAAAATSPSTPAPAAAAPSAQLAPYTCCSAQGLKSLPVNFAPLNQTSEEEKTSAVYTQCPGSHLNQYTQGSRKRHEGEEMSAP